MTLPQPTEHQIQQGISNYLKYQGKIDVQCSWCGKAFKRKPSDLRYTLRRNPKAGFYCSKSCSGRVSNRRDGHISVKGYKQIRVDGKYVQEHRYVVEQSIGRKLGPREHVHHINHDKLDNRIENLQVLDIREHGRLEGRRASHPKRLSYA